MIIQLNVLKISFNKVVSYCLRLYRVRTHLSCILIYWQALPMCLSITNTCVSSNKLNVFSRANSRTFYLYGEPHLTS